MSRFHVFFFVIASFSFSAFAEPSNKCTSVEACIGLIQEKISSNLIVDENFAGEVIVIEFRINDSGEVRNPKVTANSGKKYIELEGLKALKKSSPFSELLYLNASDFEKFKFIKLNIEI
jgi:membrane protein involved in colicin uptake